MNGNVSFSTKPDKLNIIYGIDYPVAEDEVSDFALSSFNYIATDVSDIKTNYIKMGFHLYECEMCEYYKEFGYFTLAEFANANFGLDKSALSKCLNVFKRFAVRDERFVYKMFLQDSYKDYTYSQLCEMVSLKSEELKRISPDMTISQIREYKKSLKTTVTTVATSQPVCPDKVEDVKTYGSFDDEDFISDLLMQCKLFIFRNAPKGSSILGSSFSGKRFSFESDDGNVYSIQISKTAKKGESS